MEIEKILQKTDSLQQKTCWVFDFMPMRVPPARGELFSLLEPQLLAGGERQRLAERLARVALRLVCYFDFEAIREASGIWQPVLPQALFPAIRDACLGSGWVSLLLTSENALLTASEQVLTLYNAGKPLRELSEQLAASEGLFFRYGEN